MEIRLAKSAGFCFGVKRAFEIALNTARRHKDVYILGNIVHNEIVARQTQDAGIKKISRLSQGKNKILLIRAHGACLKTIKLARKLGYRIVDATCPMVKEIHRIAREMENKGYAVIVIGDREHDEVHSIIGQLRNKAILVDPSRELPFKDIKPLQKACVVAQSTQNIDTVRKIVRQLRPLIRELKFCNTICKPTRIKQKEMQVLPRKSDVMIVIGSKSSANTKRLYEISKSLNRHTYWVNEAGGIKKAWFRKAKTVGITAGASTPQRVINGVVNYLLE